MLFHDMYVPCEQTAQAVFMQPIFIVQALIIVASTGQSYIINENADKTVVVNK